MIRKLSDAWQIQLEAANTGLSDSASQNGTRDVTLVPPGQITHFRSMLLTLFGLVMVGYFAFHTLQGERGFLSYLRLSEELTIAQAQLAALEAEAEMLEQRVALLRTDSLDTDMLEERARLILNFTRKDEVIILRTGLEDGNDGSSTPVLPSADNQIDG